MKNSRITLLENNSLQIHAPAKLNLGLRVSPLRPDGFHNIESWFVPLAFHDTLTFAPATSLEFEITGRIENIPTDPQKNLITKAASLLANHAKIPPNAKITLHKQLPPGGGLGGGSSDAASTLLALTKLWNLPYTPEQLLPLAAQLGSDVPFFIHATPALCTGRGEIITPLRLTHTLLAILIIPTQGCPTKEVFHAFDAGHRHTQTEKTDWQLLANSRAEQLNELLLNDLAPAAYKIAPWLAALKKQTVAAIQQPIHLTGSGSTLFTLAASPQKAAEIHSQLTATLAPATTILPTQILRAPLKTPMLAGGLARRFLPLTYHKSSHTPSAIMIRNTPAKGSPVQMTLTISDDLASRLKSLTPQLPQILELGIREYNAQQEPGFASIHDVLEKLAALPEPQEVLALRPSPTLQARITQLLEKNRSQTLSPNEQNEWQHYQYVEHLVRLAKARATQRLHGK